MQRWPPRIFLRSTCLRVYLATCSPNILWLLHFVLTISLNKFGAATSASHNPTTATMPSFTRLIRFESADNGQIYFADLGADVVEPPSEGTHVKAYASLDDLLAGKAGKIVTLGKVMTSQYVSRRLGHFS